MPSDRWVKNHHVRQSHASPSSISYHGNKKGKPVPEKKISLFQLEQSGKVGPFCFLAMLALDLQPPLDWVSRVSSRDKPRLWGTLLHLREKGRTPKAGPEPKCSLPGAWVHSSAPNSPLPRESRKSLSRGFHSSVLLPHSGILFLLHPITCHVRYL